VSGEATPRFWLDGGYDRDQVEACEYHPDHRWEVIDVKREGLPDTILVVCKGCFVPRCGDASYIDRDGARQYEDDPCMLPRHHEEPHVAASGASWPIGGSRA